MFVLLFPVFSKDDVVLAVLSATGGAVLTAAGAVAVNQFNAWSTRRNERKALAHAIAAELEALRLRYAGDNDGQDVLDYGFEQPRFNYFVVFEANAAKLGVLRQEDAGEVVRVYVLVKGHFEDVINRTKLRNDPDWSSGDRQKFEGRLKRDQTALLEAVPALCDRLNSY